LPVRKSGFDLNEVWGNILGDVWVAQVPMSRKEGNRYPPPEEFASQGFEDIVA